MPTESLQNIAGVARLDDIVGPTSRPSATPPPAAATAGMLAPSTATGDPAPPPRHLIDLVRGQHQQEMADTRAATAKQWENVKANPARTGAILAAGAVPGAGIIPSALMGAAGAGTGLVLKRISDPSSQPLSVPESLGTMATEGGIQGVLSAAGQGLAQVGRGLYTGGVALLPRTLKNQFPNLAKTGLEEGIALTRGGAAEAEKRLGQSRASADSAIASAEQAGVGPVSTRRVIRSFRPVRTTMQNRAALGLPDETGAVAARARSFARQNPGGIPPTRAQALKREAQDLSESAYRAQERGANVNSTDLQMNEAQAGGLRGELERLVPEVGPINQRTQGLLGLTKAAEHASGTGHILSRLGGAGVTAALLGSGGGLLPAVAGAGAGAALTSPGGLTLTGLGVRKLGQAGPNLIRAAMLARMSQQKP